ncbi:DUF1819 family protein [Escherichia coli]|nr:DUF1819 family protein [Escherichia coli]
MNIKEYLGDLIGSSLLITESRIIAESLLKKLPEDEWKSLIVEQNVLQKKIRSDGYSLCQNNPLAY